MSALTCAFQVCAHTRWHRHNLKQHTAVAGLAGQRQSGNTAMSGICIGTSLNDWCAVPTSAPETGKENTHTYMI